MQDFTLDDIKDGMRIKCRNGNMYVKIGDTFRSFSGYNIVISYQSDMTFGVYDSTDYDIIEVYDDCGFDLNPHSVGTLLWKRVELTQEQKDIIALEKIIKHAQEKIQAIKEKQRQ